MGRSNYCRIQQRGGKMMKNKLLTTILIVLVTFLLVAVIVFALVLQLDSKGDDPKPKEPTIDEIVEATIEIPEITTNLAENQFIKLDLKIQTDSTKAAEELEKREFQVRDLVIQELSEMTKEELEGKAGKKAFKTTIQSSVNALMQEGEVEDVYIVSYIIQ